MKIGLLIFFSLLLISCKKNDVFGDIEPNTSRVIAEFTDARTGTHVAQAFTPNPLELELTELRIEPRSVVDGDIKVKVIVNPVVVAEYNAANGTTYTPVPATAFSLLSNEFAFNRERRTAMVRATISPSAILDDTYAVGLSIAEVSNGEISSIAKSVIVFISIKNAYDGIYSIKGYSEIPGTGYIGNFTVPCSEEVGVVTASDNAVFLSPAQPVADGGSFVYISNLLPTIQFDLTTNKVTGVTAQSGGIDLIFPYDAGYDSRYDPATKTIYLKYGVAPMGSGRFIIDTLTYCGPR
jgi:hypothetical protein